MMQYDLHMHSTASDGTVAAGDLPTMVAAMGLGGFSLTDHDTTAGHAAAAEGAARAGLAFIPGIEISSERGQPRGAMHILGYGVREDSRKLCDVIQQLHAARAERAPLMVDKLRAMGVDVTLEEVSVYAGCAMIGRPHIAGVLMQKGYVASIKEGFMRFVGQGGPAYVRKDNLTTAVAIEAIHDAGGVAVLAHPIQLRYDDDDDDLRQILRRLMDEGLDGIEVVHSDHDEALEQHYNALADEMGLLKTGGSDFHGTTKTIKLGSRHIGSDWFQRLCEAIAS